MAQVSAGPHGLQPGFMVGTRWVLGLCSGLSGEPDDEGNPAHCREGDAHDAEAGCVQL